MTTALRVNLPFYQTASCLLIEDNPTMLLLPVKLFVKEPNLTYKERETSYLSLRS